MISLKLAGQGADMEARLVSTANTLAQAHGQMIAASRREEGSGWRSAPLLWPLIDRDI